MSEPEIWYIQAGLAFACVELKQKGIFHGDIQPNNILIDQESQIKLIDTPLFSDYKDGYERLRNKEAYYSAQSPQQLSNLRASDIISNADPEKSDVFSIGITTLCSVVNNPITSFYDFSNYEIVNEKIEEKQALMLQQRYSNELIRVIGNCLSKEESQRPSFENLCEYIRPHMN